MEISGEQRIAASREVVWAALNDPEILRRCIPGCQELEKHSDTAMTAVAVIKVGPVSARFRGTVTLSDLDPPNGYRIAGEGQGGVAGFANGSAEIRLTPDGDGTILSYVVAAQIGGKLAQLGGRLIDATARKMSDAFFQKFSDALALREDGRATQADPPHTRPSHGPAGAGSVAAPRPQRTPDRMGLPVRTEQPAWLRIGLWLNTAALVMAASSIAWMLHKTQRTDCMPRASAIDWLGGDLTTALIYSALLTFGYMAGIYGANIAKNK